MRLDKGLSQVELNTLANTRSATSMSYYMLSLWNLFRLALVCACMLFAVLVSMVYSLNRSGTAIKENHTNPSNSPLSLLLNKDQNRAEELQDTDCGMLKKINDHATLELKTLVIAETVVPYADREKLFAYVKQQLDASDVITETQKSAVLTMVNLAPVEASVNKEETGEMGTLRNSAVIALFKRHFNNIHFMLIGVRAEPRLGWKWISSSERNAWNDVLSRLLYNKISYNSVDPLARSLRISVSLKVRVEAKSYLWTWDAQDLMSSNNVVSSKSLETL